MVRLIMALAAAALLAHPHLAAAVDGVIEINQAAALAGGVTSGDAAGFPVSISVPGNYRLTSNLVMPNQSTTAIQLMVFPPASRSVPDSVSIDLNGFAILGDNTCAGSACTANGTGVGVESAFEGTSVVNGTVRGMGSSGVKLGLLARVQGVIAVNNGGYGISVGNASLVENSQVRSNRLDGIRATDTSTVRNNVADVNGAIGIWVLGNATVVGNTSNANQTDGIAVSGATVAGGALIQGNTTNGNSRYGINVAFSSTVLGNEIHGNGTTGLFASSSSDIGWSGNVSLDNPPGCMGGLCQPVWSDGSGRVHYLGCNVLEVVSGTVRTCCPYQGGVDCN